MTTKDLKDHPFVGQVIIERGFASEEAARNWMSRIANHGVAQVADNVETHLWEENVKR